MRKGVGSSSTATGRGGKKAAPPLRANPALTNNSLDVFRKLTRGVLEPIPSKENTANAEATTAAAAGDTARRSSSPEQPAAFSSPSLPTSAQQKAAGDSEKDLSEASPLRAGSAPPRPETTRSASGNGTHSSRQGGTSHKRRAGHEERGVRFQSFLDEVPVEACLEYLTRPHASWDSAVNTMRKRLERIEELNATVRSRSFASSRAASFASLESLNTTMNSVASAPAGFPRSASNGSRSKTGTLLRRGRLGTAGSAGAAGNATSTPPLDLAITGESTTADVLALSQGPSAGLGAPSTAPASDAPRARSSGRAPRTSTSSSATAAASRGGVHAPRGGTLAKGSAPLRLGTSAPSSRDGLGIGRPTPSPKETAAGSRGRAGGSGRAASPGIRAGTSGSAKTPKAPPPQSKKAPQNKAPTSTSSHIPDLFIGPSH